MRTSYFTIAIFLACQIASAAEVSAWQRQASELVAAATAQDLDQAKAQEVLDDLNAWDPDKNCSLWELIMTFRDVYLHSPTFNRAFRAPFWPEVLKYGFEWFQGGRLPYGITDILRIQALAHEGLIQLHKLPYVYNAKDKTLFFKELGLALTAMGSQSCALLGSTCDFLAKSDSINSMFYIPIGLSLKGAGIIFLVFNFALSVEGDYFDVALRSLKHYYKQEHNDAKLLVVKNMIFIRKNQHEKTE
jgi:hypothetical protein